MFIWQSTQKHSCVTTGVVACDIDEAVRQVKHLVQILKREKLFISLAKTVFATEWLRFLVHPRPNLWVHFIHVWSAEGWVEW